MGSKTQNGSRSLAAINTTITEIVAAEIGGHGLGDGTQLPGGRRVRQDLQGQLRHAARQEAAGHDQGAAGQRAD